VEDMCFDRGNNFGDRTTPGPCVPHGGKPVAPQGPLPSRGHHRRRRVEYQGSEREEREGGRRGWVGGWVGGTNATSWGLPGRGKVDTRSFPPRDGTRPTGRAVSKERLGDWDRPTHG
jgi:hypothetical protein